MNTIKIKIPDELKEEFHNVKNSYKKDTKEEKILKKIEKYLEEDNIVSALKYNLFMIYHLRYTKIKEITFYKNYLGWLDFALTKIMNSYGIDVSNHLKKRDMYLALNNCQRELYNLKENLNKEELIEKSTYITYILKDTDIEDNDIKSMCTIFINIGLNLIIIEENVDITYDDYLFYKKKEFKTKLYNHFKRQL